MGSMRFAHGHLAYCTNIHPAESWPETFSAISTHALAVRELLEAGDEPFAIGLRLSARAAGELLEGDELARFRDWLARENAYVFTINGFPYGDFHGTRVKEQVYRPDWSTPERLDYTKQLFAILSRLLPSGCAGSVSTLPGSFKAFHADEARIRAQLVTLGDWLDELSDACERDLHLGLEPEPLGHFENTPETLRFFDRLLDEADDHERIKRRIGVNYDCCHFALEFEDAASSLSVFRREGLRISKIHLSAALAIDPRDDEALERVRAFDEPTYLHQVIARHANGSISRFADLPDGLAAHSMGDDSEQWRIHFHIPLDHRPEPPLRSTRIQVEETLRVCADDPGICEHFEIETYTWSVLPEPMQRSVEEQLAGEYRWVLSQCQPA